MSLCTFLALATLCLALACQKAPESPDLTRDKDVVARVGDQQISLADLEDAINKKNPLVRSRYRSHQLKKKLLIEMVEQEALAVQARQQGHERDPAVQERFKKLLVRHLLGTEAYKTRLDQIEISDDQVERHFQDNLPDFQAPEKRRAYRLFFKPSDRRAARETLEQLQAQPQHRQLFDQLRKQQQDAGIQPPGPDTTVFQTRAQFESGYGKSFADAVFSLDAHKDISPVVETDQGLYLARLAGKRAPIHTPFEQAERSIRATLLARARTQVHQSYLDELKRSAGVEVFTQVVEQAQVKVEPAPAEEHGGTLRVLTDRTASHLENLFEHYEKAKGARIEVNYVGDSLLARLENRPREADVIITKNADLLELAKQKKLLGAFDRNKIARLAPPIFQDPQGHYIILSFRARAIYYARERVSVQDLTSYADLILPRWKGRVCIRSGFHEYNLSWLTQMAASEGLDSTRSFILGLRDNLARPPKGNDRAQVRALFEGTCDLAIANSYYMGIMLQRDDQKAWAQASGVFFPDQAERGAYVMRSGAGLTTSSENPQAANQLLAFLCGEFAQRYFSEALFEYPVRSDVPLAAVNAGLGKDQGIKGGACKINLVELGETMRHRKEILEILTQANFDLR